MRPLLSWPGGKARVSKRIAGRLPTHDVYVEPFAGGASVFFEKSLASVNALGDKSKWLMRFYNQVRRGGLRKCQRGVSASRASFRKYSKCPSACCRFFTNALSYHGNMKEMGALDRGFYHAKKLSRLPEYEHKLRNAHLRTDDFASTMRKFDSPNTLHFLDPPWPTSYSKNYRYKDVMPVSDVRRASEKMSGKVAVIYNEVPEVVREFKRRGWKMYRLRTTQSGGKSGSVPTSFILAVRGFRIKR